METKTERIYRWHSRMMALGLSPDDLRTLRRCEMTLARWHEAECGTGNDYADWHIERDETTGRPYMVTCPHTGTATRRPIADRAKGAIRRAAAIAARYGLSAVVQSDPRGCALYVGRGIGHDYTQGVACNY